LEQLPPLQPKKGKRLKQILAITALGLTGSGIGIFFYGKYFLEQQLSPLVQAELNKLLNRPVTLGGVDRFSWNGVRFGKTEVPATDTQPNFAVAEAIDVQVDVWNYLQTQQIGLEATVVKPQVFLRQDFANGQYLPEFAPITSTRTGNIDLRAVKIEDADLTLQPLNSKKAIALTKLNLQSEWQLNNPNWQGVKFTGAGKVVNPKLLNLDIPNPEDLKRAISSQASNGTLNITNAEFNFITGSGNLYLRSQDIGVAVVDGFFPEFPVTPLQGKTDGTVVISLKPNSNQADIQGNLRVRDVGLKVREVPQPLKNISGDIQFDGMTATLQGISGSYGTLLANVEGTMNLQSGLNLDVALQPTDIAKALKSLNIKTPLAIAGEVKLNAKITGKQPQVIANFSSTKPITIDRLIVTQIQGQIESKDAKSLNFKQIRAKSETGNLTGAGVIGLDRKLGQELGRKPDRVASPLNPNLNASLKFNFNLENINSEAIAALYDTNLPIPIGTIAAQVQVNGELDRPQILATFQAPQALYPTNGEVEIIGTTATLRNTSVQFPTGNLGLVGAISLDGKRPWQLQLTSNGIPLSIFPTLPDALKSGNLFGLIKLNSPEGSFEPKEIRASGNIDLRLQVIKEAIAATVNWNGKDLIIPRLQLGDYLGGNGIIALNPKLTIEKVDFNLRSLSSQRISRFQTLLPTSQTSSQISNQISGIDNGTVDFNAKITGALDNLKLLAKIRLDDLDIPELIALGVDISPQSKAIPQGKLSFVGEVSGEFNSNSVLKFNQPSNKSSNQSTFAQFRPEVKGVVRLVNLKLDRTRFDSLIAGGLNFNYRTGLRVDLRGVDRNKNDRIALRLDSKFQPIDFNVQLASTSVIGNTLKNPDNPNNNSSLAVKVKDVPLDLVAAIAGQGELIDGSLSSDLVVNLNRIQAIGNVAIDKPRFGRTQGEKLTAKVNFNNGNITLSDGLLNISTLQESKYRFNLAYTPNAATTLQGRANIESGTVSELLSFLRLQEVTDITNAFNPPDYGKAVVLSSLPKIRSDRSLYEQLQYFSQIKARKEQQEIITAEASSNLPPLSEFKGGLDGDIDFAIFNQPTKQNGVKLAFNLEGKSWDYGKFAVDDVKVKGSFDRGVLILDTVKLQSGDRLGQITNTKITLRELNGKVELANFPVESLRPIPFFNNLPVDITGFANGVANLSGGLFNPKAVGKITLADATINRQPLDSVGGDFDYANGRFKFNGKIVTEEAKTEPIAISGDIPYQFCPIPDGNSLKTLCNLTGNLAGNLAGTVSKALKVDISVKNEGLAFINILNTPVRWLAGKGTGVVSVSGTLDAPKAQGSLTLDRAAFQVAGLPSDVTDVLGKIDFNFDRFKADLLGEFSQGNFNANGVLAISNPNLINTTDPDYETPLTIVAERLNLDIKNLYAGFANGILAVRGALLFPEVSGKIVISDGRVILGEQSPTDGRNLERDQFNIGFNNLLVTLGNSIQVTRAPLLNLVAKGELIVNGSLNDIRPSGRVRIERGQINTISTRLRVNRDFENYADFVPSQGLNPNLNVRVLGSIPEVTRTRIDNSLIDAFNPTNVPISNLGSQRTVQIQATVTGSVQSPNIDLRSSPPRTQSELLTLIGGGLLQQGGNDPTAVLANLAGGTIIGFLQDAIGGALDLAEFNLTPTTTNTRGGGLSTIGVAAEAAINLTSSFSFAVRSVLNDPSQVTSYTLRYRANPNTQVLTNTDLNGNNSVSVEYESRF